MTDYRPARGDKPSKSPLYAEALRIYLTEPASQLVEIAERVGLRSDTLIQVAERQAWSKRRAIVLRDTSQERAQAVLACDSKLVAATVEHVDRLATGWQELTLKIVKIDTEPDRLEDETDRDYARHCASLLERKADLMRRASQGVREMAEVAQTLGLIKSPKEHEEKPGRVDLSKLTQLNIVLQQAQREVGVEPIELGEDLI